MNESHRSYRPRRGTTTSAYQPVHIAGNGASINFTNVRTDDDMSNGYESDNMKVK